MRWFEDVACLAVTSSLDVWQCFGEHGMAWNFRSWQKDSLALDDDRDHRLQGFGNVQGESFVLHQWINLKQPKNRERYSTRRRGLLELEGPYPHSLTSHDPRLQLNMQLLATYSQTMQPELYALNSPANSAFRRPASLRSSNGFKPGTETAAIAVAISTMLIMSIGLESACVPGHTLQ